MKTADLIREHRAEGTEQHAVSVKPSGKLFKSLIDKMYSDKIGSIVRELMTNAWDSHKAAGKSDIPFSITAPSRFNPTFKVRDFGVGMDHQTVMNVYSVLFESSKDGSNDEAGMYGLGSKTPWARASMFNLTCFDGRERREYVCAIGEDYRPVIHIMGSTPDSSERGVLVEVPVDEDDIAQYEAAIERVTLGFDVPPECNQPSLVHTLPEATLSGDGWRFFNSSAYDADKDQAALDALEPGWHVRMGPVIYPLQSKAGLELPDLNTGRKIFLRSRSSVVIDMPIGSIGVVSSREYIDYQPATVKALSQAVKAMSEACIERVREQCADIRCPEDYHAEMQMLTPGFAQDRLEEDRHPWTGMKSGHWLSQTGVMFRCDISDFDRGEYVETHFTGTAQHPLCDTVIRLDIEPEVFFSFNDKGERGPEKEGSMYTARERRFILRQMRRIMMARGIERAIFAIGLETTNDFLSMIYPKKTIDTIALDEFLNAKPVRIAKDGTRSRASAPMGVRGLRLVERTKDRLTCYEKPVPVPAWEEVDSEIVFFDSDDWSSRAGGVEALANAFGFERFYLASNTARQRLTEEFECVHALDAAENFVRREANISLKDWDQVYSGISTRLELAELFYQMRQKTPKAYRDLLSQRNEVARYARLLETFAHNLRETPADAWLNGHAEQIVRRHIKERGIEHTKTFDAAWRISRAIYNSLKDHPAVALLEKHDRSGSIEPEVLAAMPQLVRSIVSTVPIHMASAWRKREEDRNRAFNLTEIFAAS